MPKERTVWRRNNASRSLERHTEPLADRLPLTSILIKVHAVSLNYRDMNILNGTNPWPTLDNGIPCSDAAGEVIAIGDSVARFAVGDKVCPILDQLAITGDEQRRAWLGGEIEGVLASHIVMDQETCVCLPAHLPWEESACLPNAGVTAWSSLVDSSRSLRAGQTVLLQGTGGVSIMALKLALAFGSKAIITSSSDEKLDKVRSQYPQVKTINYRTTPNWHEKAVDMNGGRGVDIVLDIGGTSSLLKSLRAVAKGGTISQVGYLSKQDVADLEGFIHLLIDKTAVLRGINVGSRRDFEQMNEFVGASGLQFDDIIDETFPTSRLEEAFGALRSQKFVGKIVIMMEQD
ncbi:hypothetical protein LTR78_000812 [Recurvomyces mirabilis]|uniref:Enoyl reductase (ER) domain-containing protein n=1 Tax=Recurvomyces mirabilis TaxID=574656 RepID=A0AAE0WWR6_9PEZI|nr:hypothetical protein LTR78_000812 [Recurvomyces mirabilis]KAK5158781.1 hypothetical protein LTS14_002889 [Recurvomyces mirabilis]